MHEKLKDLLIKIKLDEEYHPYFNNGLLKVVVNQKEKSWTFNITIDQILPVDVYKLMLNSIKETFSDLPNIKEFKLHINSNNIDTNLIKDYWVYTLETLKLIHMLEHRHIELSESTLVSEVYNKVEYNKLLKHKDQIEELYHMYGFHKFDLDIIINENGREEIKKEITKDLEKSTEKLTPKIDAESNILFGTLIKPKADKISAIQIEENDVIIEGYIFSVDYFESSKSNFKIITIKITDYVDSIYAKLFSKDSSEFGSLKKKITTGIWVKVRGYTKNDLYSKDLVLNVRDINLIEPKEEIIKDEALVKRVELHTHTHMSQMDSVVSAKDLIKRAKKWGHKAIAITDHNGLQALPDAYHEAKDIKVIYGVEATLIDDSIDIIFRPNNSSLEDNTYVVFDFETTGFNAGGGDSIIEVGAVKLQNGEIIDRFSCLINPGRELPAKITEITGITNKDLKDKPSEEEVIRIFMEWTKDLPMVAHNAKFDASFLKMAYQKYNLGEYTNPLIDTLELSRVLDPSWGRHGLSQLVKRYEIPFDEDSHHRGDYDAEATALIFHKMIKKLTDKNIDTLNKINNLVSKEDLHKIGNAYHVTLLAKNNIGLKNLFKIVSLTNTKYFYKTPRILRSEIESNREGLLIGSGCSNGELFNLARSKSSDELTNIVAFYDYIEVQPISVYNHLIQIGDFGSSEELKEHIKKLIKLGKDNEKLVVATGDVHQLEKRDKIYREIIINQKVPGGGRHPLARTNITSIPFTHLMTTNEMLEEFNFIDKELANEIVVTNTNIIADMIDNVQVIKDKLYSPKMENADSIIKDIVYQTSKEIYGDPLPLIIEERLTKELNGIIGGGFDVIYLIAEKLVKKSNNDGYLVGSRGSVGSSLVAFMLGITEVNALPAHYICNKCKQSIFEIDGEPLGSKYPSGYDLPDKICVCGNKMNKEGQDMPFATFLGFKADKVPDIDLNFSGEYQAKAHDYTKVLFGEHNVFRAGTIGTVADKTAFGFVKGFMEEKNVNFRLAEVERLALGCTGVKRTTGQHPGGIIVVPDYMDIFDFSPYQNPADDTTSKWFTTHFDFHAIHDNILKLDILGHDDPTVLKMLQDISGINILDIPFDDKEVLSIFSSPNALDITKDDIMCETGTLGIPEYGTKFVIKMLEETRPQTFAELVKVSGLSHGTDVWTGNAQNLIHNNTCEFKDVIGCRDDIMVYLSYNGLEPQDAFKIMEFVRKGKPTSDPEGWIPFENLMKEKKIVDWYIDSCRKIQYMFPKAHATAYVMMATRVAWFKVHMPIHYYSAYFSIRCSDFDIDTMIKGYKTIKDKVIEITNKGYDATQKETSILDTLMIAMEMCARGFKFGSIDLYKSDSRNFIIDTDNKTLIPPFRSIDGLGDTVATNIVEERQKSDFISIEDLQKRSKLSTTLIDKLRVMGVLQDLPESSQLSLF